MAPQDFFFALEFSSQGAPAALVEDLAAHVCRHVGCAPDVLPQLTKALEEAAALSQAGGQRRCDVQFRARSGVLEVLVSSNGGRIWQTSVPLS